MELFEPSSSYWVSIGLSAMKGTAGQSAVMIDTTTLQVFGSILYAHRNNVAYVVLEEQITQKRYRKWIS